MISALVNAMVVIGISLTGNTQALRKTHIRERSRGKYYMRYSSSIKPSLELTYSLLVLSVSVVRANVHIGKERS